MPVSYTVDDLLVDMKVTIDTIRSGEGTVQHLDFMMDLLKELDDRSREWMKHDRGQD